MSKAPLPLDRTKHRLFAALFGLNALLSVLAVFVASEVPTAAGTVAVAAFLALVNVGGLKVWLDRRPSALWVSHVLFAIGGLLTAVGTLNCFYVTFVTWEHEHLTEGELMFHWVALSVFVLGGLLFAVGLAHASRYDVHGWLSIERKPKPEPTTAAVASMYAIALFTTAVFAQLTWFAADDESAAVAAVTATIAAVGLGVCGGLRARMSWTTRGLQVISFFAIPVVLWGLGVRVSQSAPLSTNAVVQVVLLSSLGLALGAGVWSGMRYDWDPWFGRERHDGM